MTEPPPVQEACNNRVSARGAAGEGFILLKSWDKFAAGMVRKLVLVVAGVLGRVREQIDALQPFHAPAACFARNHQAARPPVFQR